MNHSKNEQDSIDKRVKHTTKLLAKWTGLWLVSLALVAFGPKFLWDFGQVFTVIAIAINIFIGYKMIIANKIHLMGLDELQQRIQLEAMALSLGITLVFGSVYGLFKATKLLEAEPNTSVLIVVMGLTYFIGVLIGNRKFS